MVKSELTVQPFDCMNYFYHEVQEHFIRELTRFNGHLDEIALKRAAALLVSAVPLISCCFDTKTHCWRKQNFTADAIVHLVEVQAGEENPSEKLLLSSIDITCEPQIKIFLIQEPNCDTLCVIINHMVSDGTGFKELLYLLSDLYAKCKKDADYSNKPKPKDDRSLGQLLKNLSFAEKLSILFSETDSPKQSNALILPLKGNKSQPFLAVRRIEQEQFAKIKGYAKNNHVSVNDMMLTAYLRVLHQVTKCDMITVPCPVDLRKYKAVGQECGVCHLTSNYVCSISIHTTDSFEDTLKQISMQMQAQKLSNACLKGPMLLNILFHVLPFQAVRRLFRIPITSYTNLGIIDAEKFNFDGLAICDAYIATAVKYVPYFQVSISTYANCCTLTSCSHSTENDKKIIENVLEQMQNELSNLVSAE